MMPRKKKVLNSVKKTWVDTKDTSKKGGQEIKRVEGHMKTWYGKVKGAIMCRPCGGAKIVNCIGVQS